MDTVEKSRFNYKIEGGPDYSMVTVDIPSGQTLRVERSSMATMDSNLKMNTKWQGFKKMLSGEALFINEFTAENGDGEIKIAPAMPGDIFHYHLDAGEEVMLQSSAFLASSMEVTTDSKWGGVKGFFSGMGLFLIKCTGDGDLWFNSYGGIIEIDVTDSHYVVDTAHIVGFTHNLDYRVKSVAGYKSLFLSGEGLVCEFSGTGKVWVQSRKVMPLTSWVQPFRRVQKSN